MKALGTVLLLLYVSVGFSQKYSGDSWAKVKSSGSGTLTVFYVQQPRLIYKEGDKLTGFCVDLLADFVLFVKEKHGKKITISYQGPETSFAEFLQQAQQSKFALGVTNVSITDERKKLMKFTPYFLANPLMLITHKDAPNLTSISEIKAKLSGYSAEVINGSTHIKYIEKLKKEQFPELKISYAKSGLEILTKMSENPKLFTILDFIVYTNATRKVLPLKNQQIDLNLTEELGFVMAKNSDWDEVWNEFLTPEYRKSVKYRKMIADNLGSSFLSMVK
jgi:ABC-type amino acid transport substrate-binding protein